QPRTRRPQGQRGARISREPRHLLGPHRHDLLRQGASDLHGIERGLLRPEPPRRDDRNGRRQQLNGFQEDERPGRPRGRPFRFKRASLCGCLSFAVAAQPHFWLSIWAEYAIARRTRPAMTQRLSAAIAASLTALLLTAAAP